MIRVSARHVEDVQQERGETPLTVGELGAALLAIEEAVSEVIPDVFPFEYRSSHGSPEITIQRVENGSAVLHTVVNLHQALNTWAQINAADAAIAALLLPKLASYVTAKLSKALKKTSKSDRERLIYIDFTSPNLKSAEATGRKDPRR